MDDLSKIVLTKDLRKLKNKRGQGEGADYTPFIYVHEISSNGDQRGHKDKKSFFNLASAGCSTANSSRSALAFVMMWLPMHVD